jgi:hypothetical protein
MLRGGGETPEEPGGGVLGGPGNPGNDRPVGNAGEKDAQQMRNSADTTGVHGMSDNPNKHGGPN